MTTKAIAGELRMWNDSKLTFVVIGVEGFRVDVIRHDGKRDGYLAAYLERNSHVISEALSRAA
jgi:glycosidase